MLSLDSGRAKRPLKDTPKDTVDPLVSGSPCSALSISLKFSSVDQAHLTSKTNTGHRNDTERAEGHENWALSI